MVQIQTFLKADNLRDSGVYKNETVVRKQTHFFQTDMLPLFSSGSHVIYDIPYVGPLKLL